MLRRERPPRPLHQRTLRDIFLMSRPPLLGEEGSGPPTNFVKKTKRYGIVIQEAQEVQDPALFVLFVLFVAILRRELALFGL